MKTQGEPDEHEKLVSVIREVDVVISALAYPQVLDQFKIIDAIKVAGNIKRFLPSDFGCEEDTVRPLPPFDNFLEKKRRIRRAIEAAGIPYTFVLANCFGAYFVNILLRPFDQPDHILVYGSGGAKAICTIKVANDPKTCNRDVICRPQTNVISQLQLISLWEQKTGHTFKRVHIAEEDLVKQAETLPHPENILLSILHCIFVKGETMSFRLDKNDVDASKLYSDFQFSTIDQLLDIFLLDPLRPPIAAFE
ncbi:hypothetical protein Pint_07260 [Pistacia integerrima]|uniref:Uncharacterized protein n=1 Tax=Pistacia integerrima TaxID=434235 RepID=A0ACC0XTI7_9ROSI|nr:hypothetical protein Pint_07260 [Pistacia integerrima]